MSRASAADSTVKSALLSNAKRLVSQRDCFQGEEMHLDENEVSAAKIQHKEVAGQILA